MGVRRAQPGVEVAGRKLGEILRLLIPAPRAEEQREVAVVCPECGGQGVEWTFPRCVLVRMARDEIDSGAAVVQPHAGCPR